jgi:outer membrane protein assembly factor BamB
VFSTPAVAGDLVHIGACNGTIYALGRDGGDVRWRHHVGPDAATRQFHGDPLLTEALIVIGSDAPHGHPGHLVALDRTTGRQRWAIEAGRGVTSDVVQRGDLGYAVSLDDELMCFDLATGRLRWRFATGARTEGVRTSSPVVVSDRVYFVGLDWTAYALDADSGRVLWSRSLESPATTTPALAGRALFFATEDGRLHRLDPVSGAMSSSPLEGGPFSGPVMPAGDSLLVLLGPGSVTAYDVAAGRIRWTRSAARNWTSSRPYRWHGNVLVGTEDGELLALDLADGAVRWTYRIPGMIRGIGTTDSALFVGTFSGRVHALRLAP